jgi:hypothetical protein
MDTNKRRPSDMENDWDGNSNDYLHCQRLGRSAKVKIGQIVDAAVAAMPAPAPPSQVAGLETGDIVAKPQGTYVGFLECNGAYRPSSDAPALAALLNTVSPLTYAGYLDSSIPRKSLGTTEIVDIQAFREFTVVLGSAYLDLVSIYDDSFNRVASFSIPPGLKHLIVSDNAIYVTDNSYTIYSITYSGGLWKSQYIGFSTQSSNGGLSAISISGTEDYLAFNTTRRIINPVTNAARIPADRIQFSAGNYTLSDTGGSLCKIGGRYFGAITIAGQAGASGVYELFFDETGALVTTKMVYQSAAPVDCFRNSGEIIYFGSGGLQNRIDIASGAVTAINAPGAINGTASKTFAFCLKNMVFYNGLSNTAGYFGAISFDYGDSFKYLPAFNTRCNTAFINPRTNKLIFAGDVGSIGSIDASSGNAELHQLTLIDSEHFRAPLKTGAVQGYKYYVKK